MVEKQPRAARWRRLDTVTLAVDVLVNGKRYDGIGIKAATIGEIRQARGVVWVQWDKKNDAAHAAPLITAARRAKCDRH